MKYSERYPHVFSFTGTPDREVALGLLQTDRVFGCASCGEPTRFRLFPSAPTPCCSEACRSALEADAPGTGVTESVLSPISSEVERPLDMGKAEGSSPSSGIDPSDEVIALMNEAYEEEIANSKYTEDVDRIGK
jgi:hypothetical protein